MTVKTFFRNCISYFFKFEKRTGFNRIHSFIFFLLEITGCNVFRESFFRAIGDKVVISVSYLSTVFALFVSVRCAYIFWEDKEEVITALIATMTMIQVKTLRRFLKQGEKCLNFYNSFCRK